MKHEDAVIHTFSGDFFEIMIWRCMIPLRHRAIVRVRRQKDGAELFHAGLECTAAQLRELSLMTKIAAAMVSHLDDGGAFEIWRSDHNPEERN